MCGEIDRENYKLEFVELENNRYQDMEMDISEIVDKETLIQEINELKLDSNSFYEIRLIGKRRFEVNTSEIAKYISAENILKLKDETSSRYAFGNLAEENSLRGFFVREMMERIESAPEEKKESIKRAMEIGLEALE